MYGIDELDDEVLAEAEESDILWFDKCSPSDFTNKRISQWLKQMPSW